jgi:hypothetical protein
VFKIWLETWWVIVSLPLLGDIITRARPKEWLQKNGCITEMPKECSNGGMSYNYTRESPPLAIRTHVPSIEWSVAVKWCENIFLFLFALKISFH